jgi:hypothetical protein
MKTEIVTSLCALVLGLTTITAQGMPITDLFAGSTIESGDKLFANWILVGYQAADFDNPIDLSMIEVTALPAEPGSDNPGLLFEFGEPLLAVGSESARLQFSNSVLVLDPTQQIVSTSLALTGFKTEDQEILPQENGYCLESGQPPPCLPDYARGSLNVTGHIDGFDFLNPDLEEVAPGI